MIGAESRARGPEGGAVQVATGCAFGHLRDLDVLALKGAFSHSMTPNPLSLERTERFDRCRVEVGAGEQVAFPITERREHVAVRAIGPAVLGSQIALVQSLGADPEVMARLAELEPIAARLGQTEHEGTEIDQQVKAIAKQHDRIRKNLGELGSESQKERDLRERYIESLDSDETRLEELTMRRAELQNENAELIREFARRAAEIRLGGE